MVGIGNGFAQLAKGHMASRQEDRRDEVEANAAKRMDMMQKQFDVQNRKMATQEMNEALYEWDMFGDPSGISEVSKNHPEMYGEHKFRPAGNSDLYEPGGAEGFIAPAVVNRFMSQTGMEIPEDPKERAAMLGKVALMSTPEGDKFVTPDQFAAGSNYGTFRRKKQMEEAMMMSKLQGSGASEMDMLADLQTRVEGGEKLSPLNRSRYNQLNESQKMTKPNAQRALTQGAYSEQTEKLTKNDWHPEDISKVEVGEMMLKEQQAGYEYKGAPAINTDMAAMSTMVGIRNDLLDLEPGDIASGKMENVLVDAAKLGDDETFAAMSADQQKKFLNTTELRSRVGMSTAQFLKAISGAAVSDEEFQRIMGVLTGGDITQNGIDTVISALGGATQGLYEDNKSKIQGIDEYRYPGTKANLGKKLEAFYNPEAHETESTPDGLSLKEASQAAVAEQASQAADVASTAVSAVVEPAVSATKSAIGWLADAIPSLGSNPRAVESVVNNGFTKEDLNKPSVRQTVEAETLGGTARQDQQTFLKLQKLDANQLMKAYQSGMMSPEETKVFEAHRNRLLNGAINRMLWGDQK